MRSDDLDLRQAAMQAFDQGQQSVASELSRQLLLRDPNDAVAHQILGAVALDARDFRRARAHFSAANRSSPDQASILNMLGVAMLELGDMASARHAFARSGELGLILAWRNLGNLEARDGNNPASVAAYLRALELEPQDAESHAALAHLFEVSHQLAQAKSHAEAALRIKPDDAVARIALARALLREGAFAAAEAAAAPLSRSPSASKNDQAIAWGVIGEARDQGGDPAGAFQAFTAANQLYLQLHGALRNDDRQFYHPRNVDEMTRLVARSDIAAWPKHTAFSSPTPAFLIGFPRSGTTLLDQILSSHSGITCLEEREHFANALGLVFQPPARLSAMGDLNLDEVNSVRDDYWRRVRAQDQAPPGTLIVDKMPLNIVVLPLIKAVFPDAKIIFAQRDPRDVVLSCYQQRFRMNAAMAQFLELESAASYYDLIMQLFETCRQRLMLDLHVVRYEDVVEDLEGAASGLASFLGVAYEPGMLDYRETALRREIRTPSARQVVEPLYKRSVGRWRRYAGDLAPVLPLLHTWAARLGYEA